MSAKKQAKSKASHEDVVRIKTALLRRGMTVTGLARILNRTRNGVSLAINRRRRGGIHKQIERWLGQ
jgi:predicted transcriptional regulator